MNINETNKNKFIGILIVALVIIISVISYIFIYFCILRTTAQPKHFIIEDILDCEIIKDEIVYDKSIQKDCIQITMNIKNITSKEDDSSQDFSLFCLNDLTNIEVMQNNVNIGQKYIDENSKFNNEALNSVVAPGQMITITLKYIIEDAKDILLYFSGNTNLGDNLIVNIKTRGVKSAESIINSSKELTEKQEISNVEITGVKISLVDGWYVENQAKVNVKLKNISNNATLDIEYSSSLDANQTAKETASWFTPVAEIEEIEINGIRYQKLQPTESMFVLCTNATKAKSIKITGNNIKLDDAMSLIKNLEIK